MADPTLAERPIDAERPAAAPVLLAGARDIVPMVLGIVPFALAIGATIGTTDLSATQGIASAATILAGAAQLAVVQMLDAGAGPAVVVASALIVNARLLLYSASLAPWFRHEPLGRRLLLAVFVIDQLHFTCAPRFARGDLDRRGRRLYYAGAAGLLAASWIVTQSVAILARAGLPAWTGLHIAAPLALVGLLARAAADRASVVAAATAGAVAVAGAGLPFHSSVLVAIVAGVAAGSLDRTGASS